MGPLGQIRGRPGHRHADSCRSLHAAASILRRLTHIATGTWPVPGGISGPQAARPWHCAVPCGSGRNRPQLAARSADVGWGSPTPPASRFAGTAPSRRLGAALAQLEVARSRGGGGTTRPGPAGIRRGHGKPRTLPVRVAELAPQCLQTGATVTTGGTLNLRSRPGLGIRTAEFNTAAAQTWTRQFRHCTTPRNTDSKLVHWQFADPDLRVAFKESFRVNLGRCSRPKPVVVLTLWQWAVAPGAETRLG